MVISTKRGVTEETFKDVLEIFRDYAFEKFVAWYQVLYTYHNIHKSVGVTIKACAARLQEMNIYLEYFLGPDLHTPLVNGDFISILVAMVPSQWQRKMISINFEPLNKTMLEVIEYMELSTENKKNIKKTDKTDKSQTKSIVFHRKGRKFKKGKRSNYSESSKDESEKVLPNDGLYWTHNRQDYHEIKSQEKESI